MSSLWRRVLQARKEQDPPDVPARPQQHRVRVHRYSDLTRTSNIRLLYLDPAAPDHPFSGQLLDTDIRQTPEYTPLSCTRGSTSPVAVLSLGDSALGISENVEAALFRFRSRTGVQVLWIDSICINQNDDDENEDQVSLMRPVFVRTGQAMQLLRRVHLVEPITSPSWTGIPRGSHDSSNILHAIENNIWKRDVAYSPLPQGVIELDADPNLITIRGFLRDTIKHIGTITDGAHIDLQSPNPPSWLMRLATSPNVSVVRAAPPNRVPKHLGTTSSVAQHPHFLLHDKYADFMTFVTPYAAASSRPTTAHRVDHPLESRDKRFGDVKMCVTSEGYFGLVPPSTQVGDNVFMIEQDPLKGTFIIRKHPVLRYYMWNGMVYIHNLAESVNNRHATDLIQIG